MLSICRLIGLTVIPGGVLVLAGGLFGEPDGEDASGPPGCLGEQEVAVLAFDDLAGDGQSQSDAGGAESADKSVEVRVRCSSGSPMPSSVTASQARLC